MIYLIAAIAGIVLLYFYLTRCEKCGSWKTWSELGTSYFDEHQMCRWSRTDNVCYACGHHKHGTYVREKPLASDTAFRRRS